MTELSQPSEGATDSTAAAQSVAPSATGGAVWLFSGDLLFASRIESAAVRAGRTFKLLGQWPAEASAATAPASLPPPQWVIVDLATRFGASASVIANCQAQYPSANTLAFGPHVQPQRLAEAKSNGFAQVLTRGRFDAVLPGLFTT